MDYYEDVRQRADQQRQSWQDKALAEEAEYERLRQRLGYKAMVALGWAVFITISSTIAWGPFVGLSIGAAMLFIDVLSEIIVLRMAREKL